MGDAEVTDWREQRNQRREREFRQQLRAVGAPTRETALMKMEAMQTDANYWYRRWQTAQFLNKRMMEFLGMANARRAESERLLKACEAENERLRGLLT